MIGKVPQLVFPNVATQTFDASWLRDSKSRKHYFQFTGAPLKKFKNKLGPHASVNFETIQLVLLGERARVSHLALLYCTMAQCYS
ncbi:hypothetical protein EI94DRAFT_1714266 [Lactarius quietus]|nr:hypothetical protein EI94DRAFT_1714266 [Lactarius quietus]